MLCGADDVSARFRSRLAAAIPPALLAGTLLAGAVWPAAPRGFQMLVFAALLAALGSAGWRIARRLLPEAGCASLATAAFTFAVALAAVPATWLGHFGLLRPAPFFAIVAAVFALAAFSLGATVAKYQEVKFRERPAALAFDRATAGKGTRVAYIGWNQPYFFFGGRLQNDVLIVPRSGDLAAREYTWGGSAEFPFEGWDYETWRANLERLGIEYLVVVRTGQGLERPERPWIVRRRGTFELFYRDSLIEIWRIKG